MGGGVEPVTARRTITGGSLVALSSGGPPKSGTYVANQIVVDTNGVAWWCTSGGTPGTWKFWGTGFMPGITTNDSGGTDYGAIINAYMATLPAFTDTPKLPPGTIYTATEVIPPQGITLVGSHKIGNPLVARGTLIRNLSSALSRVASCSNPDSGFERITIDGRPFNDAEAAATALGVYASKCSLKDVVVMGGDTTVFDSNSSASDLTLTNVTAWQTGGVPALTMKVDGADWLCSKVYVNGNVSFGGGGNIWSACHFVSPSSGSTNPFLDLGGNTFNGCDFDSQPAGAAAMIDRSSASRQSLYSGCNYYTANVGFSAGSAVFREASTAGAGAVVIGGQLRAAGSTAWHYFIKGPLASTCVTGLNAAYSFRTAFTDQTQPLGYFDGCFNNSVLASLGGSFPGSNVSIRAAILAAGLGVLSEPFPATALVTTPLAPTSQKVFGSPIGLRRGDVVAGIMLRVGTAAAGTNPTTVRFGLADSGGKIVAVSANRGSSGSDDAATVFAVGANKVAFSSAYTVPADGLYFAVMLVNGTWGTTQPLVSLISAGANAAMANATSAAPANFEWASQTDLPAVNSSLTITGTSTRTYYLAAYS
jgi:hypothetical protein